MTMASPLVHQLFFAKHPLLPCESRLQPRPQFSSVRSPSFSVRASSVLAVEQVHFPIVTPSFSFLFLFFFILPPGYNGVHTKHYSLGC
ncbi:hypothetical protein EUGRSUZ_C00444 [Eucalyptus grandis]|uniref:Uncharacterized protein n=2 Tax=Eucalyptus grandis TaxID=71139 RepID=A0ACC3LAF6_EUCGR|nr:hypothetical protein EUGRSUZ_C00444 [Eucalyptus grandis]